MTTIQTANSISASYVPTNNVKGMTGGLMIQTSMVTPYDAQGASGPATEQLIAITMQQRSSNSALWVSTGNAYAQEHGVMPQMLIESSLIGPTSFTFGTTSGPATVYNFSTATFTVNILS